jgi:sodium pump decarboxylase gamma subunit
MALGLGIVFVALMGLVVIVEVLHRLTNGKSEPPKKHSSESQVYEPQQGNNEVIDTILLHNYDEEVEELVAVITAAIAASLHRSTHDIVVKSVRRVPAITPVWNWVSRQEQIATRL